MTTHFAFAPVQTFPCTPNQRRFLEIEGMGAGRTALNYAFRYQVQGPITQSPFEKAFAGLLKRHEILRTGFQATASGFEQAVVPFVSATVPLVDLTHLNPAQLEAEVTELGRADASKLFDLANPPLVRLTLLCVGRDTFQVLITAHATVIDGWSLSILLSELGVSLQALYYGHLPELPDVALHFGDYALWEKEMLTTGAFAPALDYWRKELDGIAPFQLSPTRPVPSARQYPGLTRGRILTHRVTELARSHAHAHGSTLYHVAVASLAAVLHRRSGDAEVVIGTQLSGRNEEEAEAVVGPLINCVVLRLPVSPEHTMNELLDLAASKAIEAIVHQAAPFATVVDAVAPGQACRRNPLYAINFALQAAFIHDDSTARRAFGPFTIASLPSVSHSALWELNFGLVERPDGWRMSCEADAELYGTDDIDGLLADWARYLELAVDRSSARLCDLPIGVEPALVSRAAIEKTIPRSHIPALQSAHTNRPTATVTRIVTNSPLPDDRVIAYHPGAPGTPVMALNVTSLYHSLAMCDPGRPFYDIQLADDEAPKRFTPRAIGDLAADAVRLIRRARPQGPYVVLGYCVLGSVGLEAARQLREQGDVVELVVMIDTWAPGYREDLSAIAKLHRALQVRRHNFRLDFARARRGLMTYQEVISRIGLLDSLATPFKFHAVATRQPDEHPQEWYLDQIYHAYRYHRFDAFTGRVLLVRASEVCQGAMFPRDFGWGPILNRPLDILDIRGEHHEVLQAPAVDFIGQQLRKMLAPSDDHETPQGHSSRDYGSSDAK